MVDSLSLNYLRLERNASGYYRAQKQRIPGISTNWSNSINQNDQNKKDHKTYLWGIRWIGRNTGTVMDQLI